MLRRLIGEDIDLRVAAPGALHVVKADKGQLEQVLLNLAVNARDAMPEGGKLTIGLQSVSLETERASGLELSPGDYVELGVSDTGIGMDAAIAARMFEPFFTTKPQGKGTGLGLSTVFGIVKQSGGGISVETAPGKGTTFRIYLPCHVAESPAPLPQTSAARPVRGGETILLVEDEPALRRVMQRMLVSTGYRVHTAANAAEALMLCERHGHDVQLVISDVVMPGMNGRKLADRLRFLYPAMKILLTSGYTDEQLTGRMGPDEHFIAKPVDWPVLSETVRAILDSRDGRLERRARAEA